MPARLAMAVTLAFSLLAATSTVMAAEDPGQATAAADEVIQNLTLDQLAAILREAGAEEVTASPADRAVRFKSSNRNYLVTMSACNETGEDCAVVSIGRGVKAKLPLEVLNKLNDQYGGLIAASRVNEETFRILRATIVRGGVTRTNLAISLVWFVNESEAISTFINSQLVAEGRPAFAAPVVLGEIVLTPAQMASLAGSSQVAVTGTPLKMKSD